MIYELDINIPKTYPHTSNELSRSRLSKVGAFQIDRPELSMGWVDQWVGLGCGSETFPKILKLGRPLVTAGVMPDNLTND